MKTVTGLDLAGKEKNPTGLCILKFQEKEEINTKLVFSDEEIISQIEKARPDLISIDAPFDFPEEGYYRESEVLLKRKGFKPLSPLFPGMRPLVRRAKQLVEKLKTKNYKVIEVFPSASEKILGLTKDKDANEHKYDALLCALTGKAYLEDEYENLSGIIIPK